jgi:hypothetical protein
MPDRSPNPAPPTRTASDEEARDARAARDVAEIRAACAASDLIHLASFVVELSRLTEELRGFAEVLRTDVALKQRAESAPERPPEPVPAFASDDVYVGPAGLA